MNQEVQRPFDTIPRFMFVICHYQYQRIGPAGYEEPAENTQVIISAIVDDDWRVLQRIPPP